jgi:hypothetical protein
MKTIVETKTVPAEEVKVTTYGCDECDFTASSQRDVAKHYAEKHACRKETEIAGHTIRLFNSEADAKAWLNDGDGYQIRELEWGEPGWYMTETWRQRCPHGCCMDDCIRLFSATAWVNESIGKARDIMCEVTDVRRHLREAPHATG